MSSSSSDSDSDDFEPIRRIKINIKPKSEASNSNGAADVSEIKASVNTWRPLGPPTHSSLSRRQSSLSSVSSSSVSFTNAAAAAAAAANIPGANIQLATNARVNHLHSSPSCSSLVNEFDTRSPFSNFMSTISRTSSPLTILNHGDITPIAIAIQESIELIVRGHYDPLASEPKFSVRSMGNIKIAFPNSFATKGSSANTLKLQIRSTDNIIKYYASRLIKDLNLVETQNSMPNGMAPNSLNACRSIEFDMESLMGQLRQMYEQSPSSRYYNIDVLRYQIAPICLIERAPLQMCSYWRVEQDVIRLRIDLKHSDKSGFSLDRLRDISFNVKFPDLAISGIDIRPIQASSNNNNSGAQNMNDPAQIPSTNTAHISYQPQAHWNNNTKQLAWKFDNFLGYLATGAIGSLRAKIDFRNCTARPKSCEPTPVDVKFLVLDSSLSKVNVSIDSVGYKATIMKREIRSSVYRSEPYIL